MDPLEQAATAISVIVQNPPPGEDPDVPYEAIIGDMTGYREPPDENAEPDPDATKQRFAAVAVTPLTIDAVRQNNWKPRVRQDEVTVKLADGRELSLPIDVAFKKGTKFWPSELEDVPEIKYLRGMIRQLEQLLPLLQRQPTLRSRLGKTITEAIEDRS